MDFNHYLGIDVSKGSLELHLISLDQSIEFEPIDNTDDAITTGLFELCKLYQLSGENTLIIAEHTGIYTYPLIRVCSELGLSLWLQSGYEIKHSQGLQRGKNDKVDAYRIAEYGRRFRDKYSPIELGEKSIEYLRYLRSERRLLVKDRAKFQAQQSDHKDFISPEIYKGRAKRNKARIKLLDSQIKQLDQEIKEVIHEDPKLKRYLKLLTSIKGIGLQIALNVIIETLGFTKITTAKKFACHSGIAPFRYTSGTSVRSKNKVSYKANRKMKSLLFMGALSLLNVKDSEEYRYYKRKISEGKEHYSVMIALTDKLVRKMYAVIRDDRPYSKEYEPNWRNAEVA
ncbi:IS110 family transposase [Persicobacter sp. CCB-QB2]|uniref:IS110 family transposase n=1 Tax=Persicobacter sp. CCB-QB2 TaxID=1561025 RepID=UPI0006A95061|nr:IS110 family transposase [Persicobacter sp. CCB-QB2]